MSYVPDNLTGEQSNYSKDLAPLVERFLSRLPERIDQLSTALNAKDWKRVAQYAHQVRGAAGCYGFPKIAEEARQIETIAITTGSLSSAQEALERIRYILTLARR